MDFINIIKKQDFFSLKEFFLENDVSCHDIEYLEDNPYLLLKNFNIYLEIRKYHRFNINKVIHNALKSEFDLSFGIKHLLDVEEVKHIDSLFIYLILKKERYGLFSFIVEKNIEFCINSYVDESNGDFRNFHFLAFIIKHLNFSGDRCLRKRIFKRVIKKNKIDFQLGKDSEDQVLFQIVNMENSFDWIDLIDKEYPDLNLNIKDENKFNLIYYISSIDPLKFKTLLFLIKKIDDPMGYLAKESFFDILDSKKFFFFDMDKEEEIKEFVKLLFKEGIKVDDRFLSKIKRNIRNEILVELL